MSGDPEFVPSRRGPSEALRRLSGALRRTLGPSLGRIAWTASTRVPPGPVEKKLALEDHARIFRCLGTGQVAGAWFIAWALTTQALLPPEILLPRPEEEDRLEPPLITFRVPEKSPRRVPAAKRPPEQNHGRMAASRHPVKESGRIQVKVLESRQERGWADKVYTTLKGIGHGVDQEKIEHAGRLTRTDPTRLSGRAGVKREEYNPGYADGDGTGDPFDLSATSLTSPGLPDRLPGADTRGRMATGHGSGITVSSEERFRSSEEILAVVKAHSPGLRHLYNKHLKRQPGLGGKVTIRFAISPSGLVVDAAIADGTTGSGSFEAEVLASVRAWRFGAIQAHGNDIVTVPFNFSD